MRNAPLVAVGLTRKKFVGKAPASGAEAWQFTPGNAFLPARLHMNVEVVASVLANEPGVPFFRKLMKVELVKLAEAAEPNAAVMIGNELLTAHGALGEKVAPAHAFR